jgi:hypothetical protein
MSMALACRLLGVVRTNGTGTPGPYVRRHLQVPDVIHRSDIDLRLIKTIAAQRIYRSSSRKSINTVTHRAASIDEIPP